MRALLLLSLVLAAFLVIRWFRPEPSAAAREEGRAQPSEAGVHFLPTTPEPQAPVVAAVAAAPQEKTPASERAAESPTMIQAGGSADELAVAAALVHGTPAEVQAAAAGMARERALMVEAFAWQVAGERQLARELSAKVPRDSIQGREGALFEAVLSGKAAVPASAGSGAAGPLERAMEMSLAAREARSALDAKDYSAAAKGFSALLVAELAAPWGTDQKTLASWTQALNAAQHEYRWSPRGGWPAVEMKVQSGDSLIAIRKRYLGEHPTALMCAGLIERSNAIRALLQPGQKLLIPTDPASVEVDLSARYALFFLGDEVAAAWPVGVGRSGEETPPGDYVAIEKTDNPSWMKVGQDPIPFGDPRNPLGTRWIGWGQDGRKTSYGFHGTKDPESIGKEASDGCVRFLNHDVEELFQILPEGAPIRIRK